MVRRKRDGSGDKPESGGDDQKSPRRRRRRRRRTGGSGATASKEAAPQPQQGKKSKSKRKRRSKPDAKAPDSKRGGRRRRGRRRSKSFHVLGQSVEQMSERFGEPDVRSDTLTIWYDGKDALKMTRIECMIIDGAIKSARIVPAVAAPMSKDQVLRVVARYNGGNVERPQLSPHTLAGGASAIEFKDDYWAFVQTDPVGCVYGIKIWQEPLDGTVMTR